MIRIRFKGSLRCFRPTVSQPFDRAPLGIDEISLIFEKNHGLFGRLCLSQNFRRSGADNLKLDERVHINALGLTNWQRFYLFRPFYIVLLIAFAGMIIVRS